MKSLLLFKHQSFIDVITNSSSEIFVCDTSNSIDFVRDFLTNLLEHQSLIDGHTYEFDQCFGEIYAINESTLDKFIDDIVIGWELTHHSWDVDPVPDFWNFYSHKTNRDWKEAQQLHEAAVAEWKVNNLDKVRKGAMGMIIITDAGDNTIPYDTWHAIEKALNAERRHLG